MLGEEQRLAWRADLTLGTHAGAVAAVNLTAPSERGTGGPVALFQTVHPGFAAGLRLLLDRASRASIAADAAWSPAEAFAFYLSANASEMTSLATPRRKSDSEARMGAPSRPRSRAR